MKRKREELGVELYTYQQTLAKLQLNLEHSHAKFTLAAEARKKAEEDLKQSVEVLAKTEKQEDELKVWDQRYDGCAVAARFRL